MGYNQIMKTKYILHGGFASHINSDNDAFFKEILKDAPKDAKILLVYFAKELDRIPINKAEDISQFEKNNDEGTLVFDVAEEDDFLEQISSADIIYLHGGRSEKIIDTLKKFPNLEQRFEGKVIAGESAGTNVLTSEYYSNITGIQSKGLGIIPMNAICHYRESDEKTLRNIGTDKELLLLVEYKFKVFWK